MNEAETGLLQLQEMKRQQETAARTRQFLQEHPELVLGQGGGSVLGSLQQPPAGPPGGCTHDPAEHRARAAPRCTAVVPGGQDLSRFAGVSPQGGGPIPPDVMAQTMPQVTPPQSTLASLGQPQGQMQALQNRFLLDLARTSPDAAMQVQQLMQGQQDMALKRDEQRLDHGDESGRVRWPCGSGRHQPRDPGAGPAGSRAHSSPGGRATAADVQQRGDGAVRQESRECEG